MATLRDFLELEQSVVIDTFAVSTNTDQLATSGCCCAYTVPDNVSVMYVELWGAGGNGPAGCCCAWEATGTTNGAYVQKKINVTPGAVMTICAGQLGCCVYGCGTGCPGRPSFVICCASNVGGSNGTVACAPGGCGGCAQCYWHTNCVGSRYPCCCTGNSLGDLCTPMIRGHSWTNNWCGNDRWRAASGTPKLMPNNRLGNDACVAGYASMGCSWGKNHWPGGPGFGGGGCGDGYCWGGWGQGGLAIITVFG